MSQPTSSNGSGGSSDSGASSWAYRCEGFDVESPDGHVGTVRDVRYGPSHRWDNPWALAVNAGRNGSRLLIVPIDEIAEIVPAERRVVLRASPRIIASEGS